MSTNETPFKPDDWVVCMENGYPTGQFGKVHKSWTRAGHTYWSIRVAAVYTTELLTYSGQEYLTYYAPKWDEDTFQETVSMHENGKAFKGNETHTWTKWNYNHIRQTHPYSEHLCFTTHNAFAYDADAKEYNNKYEHPDC